MSIGLYDFDFSQKISNNFFNLELMKLAAYYKKKREIVVLSPDYAPERYSNFILRKDDLTKKFPSHLLRYDNLTYGGRGFSSGNYIPLDLEIEKMKADTSIYTYFDEVKKWKNSKSETFRALYNGCHFRLSLDEKTIWQDFQSQLFEGDRHCYLIIHDYDICNIEGAPAMLKKLCYLRGEPRKIVFRYPIVTEKNEILKSLFELQIATWSGIVKRQNPFGLKDAQELYNLRPKINGFKQIYMSVPNSSSEDFFTQIFPRYYDEFIYMIERGIEYHLVFPDYNDTTFLNTFCKYISDYTSAKLTKTERNLSFYQYLKRRKSSEMRFPETRPYAQRKLEDVRQALRLCYDVNYDFFCKIFELYGFEEKGGKLDEKRRANRSSN